MILTPRFFLAAAFFLNTQNIYGLDEDAAELENSRAEDAELGYTTTELRSESKYGIGLGLGTRETWQNFSIEFEQYLSPSFSWVASSGGGSFALRASRSSREYDLLVKSRSLVFGGRYFLPTSIPLFAQLTGGYAIWELSGEPRGDGEDTTDDLKFSGQLQGMVVASQIGSQILWGSGFRLEVSLLGVGKSLALQKSFSNESSRSRHASSAAIEKPHFWGLLNISLGYFF